MVSNNINFLICRFLTNVFAIGQAFSFALYFAALQAEFGQSVSATSWVGSMCICFLCGFGVVSGKLVTRSGDLHAKFAICLP